MWEVFASVTTEHGTQCGPTGAGSINAGVAQNLANEFRANHGSGDVRFYVEWVPPADAWNAY